MRYKVVEGTAFRKSVEIVCAGIPLIDAQIENLKLTLSKDPYTGHLVMPDIKNYVVAMPSGTVDWKVAVRYQVKDMQVNLICVLSVST